MSNATSPKKNKQSNFVIDFFLAGVAGAIGKTSTAPLERTKLILQNQHTIANIDVKYTGMVDCITKLVRNEGVFALWRGNFINVLRYFPNQALNFALKDTLKNIFPKYNSEKNFYKFFFINCLSGGLAGSISLSILHPIDVVRTRLATDNKKGDGIRKFNGTNDCFKKLFLNEGGVKGLYPGLVVSIVGIFQYRALYFGGYDSFKGRYMTAKNSFFEKWAAAQVITIIAGFLCYPLDTVKRRIIIQSGEVQKKYRNSFHCLSIMYGEEGFKGYFKGFSPNILRMFGSSLVLILYDEFQKLAGLTARGI